VSVGFDYGSINKGVAGRVHDRSHPLAWLKLLALDGDLARAEPSLLRYPVLHASARL
jgi:hypothetical protein